MARKAKEPGVGRGHGTRQANKQCKCIDCGTAFMAKRSGAFRCVACNERRDRQHRQRPRPERTKGQREFQCIDCGTAFMGFRIQARCEECQRKRRNSMQADHELRRRKPCIDCGALVFRRTALRCHACEGKRRTALGLMLGEKGPNWKGGRVRHNGYIRVKNPNPPPSMVGEHVLVWVAEHGPLPKGYLVHHFNGIRDDNRSENLVAMSRSEHHRNHHEPWEARIRELEAILSG